MYDGNLDQPHDREEHASYAEFRINWEVKENEDGSREGDIASVESHIHGVPDGVVIDALLILAKQLLMQSQVKEIFSEGVPDNIREAMLNMFANTLLKQRLESPEVSGTGLDSVMVPNDISELLD